MASELKTFTKEDIEKHNKETDCWIIFAGGVYDVTKFMQRHPGGKEKLLKFAGKDGTNAFNTKGNGKGHIPMAVNFRESMKIGILKEEPKPKL